MKSEILITLTKRVTLILNPGTTAHTMRSSLRKCLTMGLKQHLINSSSTRHRTGRFQSRKRTKRSSLKCLTDFFRASCTR